MAKRAKQPKSVATVEESSPAQRQKVGAKHLPLYVSPSNALIILPVIAAIVFSIFYFQHHITGGHTQQCTAPIVKSFESTPSNESPTATLPVVFTDQAAAPALDVTPSTSQSTTVNPENTAASNQSLSQPVPAEPVEASNDGAATIKRNTKTKLLPNVQVKQLNLDLFKL